MSFEQLPRESNKAFAAFRMYLEMGPERSLATVAGKLGKSKVMMEKWSRRYDWQNRVAAHAGHLAEVERLAIESLAREQSVAWGKVHEDQKIQEWRRRDRLLRLADRILDQWEEHPERCSTLEGLARVMELALKLGRQAAGMPMVTKEVKTEIKATLEVEWEVALKKIYGRVAAPPANEASAVIDVEPVISHQSAVIGESVGTTQEKGK